MIVLPRLFVAATVCSAIYFFAPNRVNAQTAPTPSQVEVHLLRGLADIFSLGMDKLADKLNRQGYSASVNSNRHWHSVVRQASNKYAHGQKEIVVLVGHSLGADATLQVANALDRLNIPVELIVTFDATHPHQAPKNVLHFVNFYQNNGVGKRIAPGPGFHGELTNLDLTADTGLRHVTIDKSDRLHAHVMQKIAEIINKDLANKVQASKSKTKKLQNRR
jgi:hypothetical protein